MSLITILITGSMIKYQPEMQKTQGTSAQSLGWEDPLEKEMTIHSSILVWRIPCTASLVGYSPYSCRDSDTT